MGVVLGEERARDYAAAAAAVAAGMGDLMWRTHHEQYGQLKSGGCMASLAAAGMELRPIK